MSHYTLELGELCIDKVFDFEYPFYEEGHKKEFEDKFFSHYYFNEIGYETVARFKQRLRHHLVINYPRYRQLYEIEMKSKDANFLFNKDYTEEFTREIDGLSDESIHSANNMTGTNKSTSTEHLMNTTHSEDSNTSSSHDASTNGTHVTEKTYTTPQSDISSITDYLDNINQNSTDVNSDTKNDSTSDNIVDGTNESNNTGNSNSDSSQDSTGEQITKGMNKTTETTKMVGKGNIGITSTAQLIEGWRSVILNLDLLIIEECRKLFMGIY